MKRILVLLLALCMMLSFASCGAKTEPAANNGSSGSGSSASSAPDESKLHGTIDGDSYTNEYLGLRIILPAGWVFYDEDQIAMVTGLTADAFADTKIAENIDKSGQLMDAMLTNNTGCSINLILQPQNVLLKNLSEEKVFQSLETQLKKQFEDAGIPVKSYEVVTKQVGGQDMTVLYMALDFGVMMDEYQVWYRTSGKYLGILTLAVPQGTDPQPFLDCLKKLD